MNGQFDITILTDERYVDPTTENTYIQNILLEDNLVAQALQAQGLTVSRKAWSDSVFDWSTTQCALFRTTWDYFDRFDGFITWLQATQHQTSFINSIDCILWNLDKHYLLDLSQKGINIPRTRIVEKGDKRDLKSHFKSFGERRVVLKPTIAGAARHTYVIDDSTLADLSTTFESLIKKEDMMIQSFMTSIPNEGEYSIIVINGQYSHAVLKKAKSGDFRVQDDFGGTVQAFQPGKAEIEFAMQCVAACNFDPVYVRVDFFKDNDGRLALGELELIEPELWFRQYPPAAHNLARSIINRWF